MPECPHCHHAVKFTAPPVESTSGRQIPEGGVLVRKKKEQVGVVFLECPNCERVVVKAQLRTGGKQLERWIWPTTPNRPVPREVPEHISKEFSEAVEVLPISAKASAALPRRCLQALLSDVGASASNSLSKQIDQVMPRLPTHLKESIDAIRNVGNFAAHPIKSIASGTVLDVELGEAEWNLETLEELFDFYYVQPARVKVKRAALEKKLKEAGKPPLK